jgi:hypothetical protein
MGTYYRRDQELGGGNPATNGEQEITNKFWISFVVSKAKSGLSEKL